MDTNQKKAIVLGAGGFIGGHLVTRLKNEGYWVCGVDIKEHEHKPTDADEFVIADLRSVIKVNTILYEQFDEIYQLAADMGGAGYIFSGEHDAEVMHNSAMINLHVADYASKQSNKPKVFYSSSACIYPEHNQLDPNNPNCAEHTAYPANPDSEYGWEKLFSERMYLSYHRNFNLDVRIARFHNIFGPYGSWNNGKEKAPAAMCRKVAEAENGGTIDVWGDGEQTRSFLYIDECLNGIRNLMNSECRVPVNIGSEEMISINNLVKMVADIAGKKIHINHIEGPLGVRGRNSDNNFIFEQIGWKPTTKLVDGMKETYNWINGLINT